MVKCKAHSMEVTIRKHPAQELESRFMHLLDPSWNILNDSGVQVDFTVPLERCGTERILKTHTIDYYNLITGGMYGNPTKGIDTFKRVSFPVRCHYSRRGIVVGGERFDTHTTGPKRKQEDGFEDERTCNQIQYKIWFN